MGLQQSAASWSRMMTLQSTCGFISLKSTQLGDSIELWLLLGCMSPACLSPRLIPKLLLSSLSPSTQLPFFPCVHLTTTFLSADGSKGLCAPLKCKEAFSHPVLGCFLGIMNCEKQCVVCGGQETYGNNSFKVFAWTPFIDTLKNTPILQTLSPQCLISRNIERWSLDWYPWWDAGMRLG